MPLHRSTIARASFQAARHLPALAPLHRWHGLHGHGFEATLACARPPVSYPGGEVHDLRSAWQAIVAPLDATQLNERLSQPGDESVLRWLFDRAAATGVQRLSVCSTPEQGVDCGPEGRPIVWRRYRFRSAHVLPHVAAGHKCGRMHGHGFEAIVAAAIDAPPGRTAYDVLDDAWAPLHMQLNYRCLNEIDGLANPTSEIISAWLWSRLQSQLPGLARVAVLETASCGAAFDGQTHRIWKEFSFDSAVRAARAPTTLPQHALHGDTFRLRLHLTAELHPTFGWTVDYGELRDRLRDVLDAIDHRPLNELAGLADADTASLAAWIFEAAKARVPQVVRVDLLESDGCGAAVGDETVGWA